jgi:hypothetical protein
MDIDIIQIHLGLGMLTHGRVERDLNHLPDQLPYAQMQSMKTILLQSASPNDR